MVMVADRERRVEVDVIGDDPCGDNTDDNDGTRLVGPADHGIVPGCEASDGELSCGCGDTCAVNDAGNRKSSCWWCWWVSTSASAVAAESSWLEMVIGKCCVGNL